MKINHKLLLVILCALAAFLPGCGSLLSRPEPPQLVVLSSGPPSSGLCSRAAPVQIVIPTPHAGAGLNTERIAILSDKREVHYVAGYKWEDNNASLMQRRLVDVLNASGCFAGAGSAGMTLRADYRLEIDLKRMHFVYAEDQKKPSADVNMLLRLIEVKSGRLLGEHTARALRRSTEDDVFKAMESAVDSAAQNALEWLREAIDEQK